MAEDNPLISILVNCYNSELYLQEALDSIYSQTYQNFQIILVDNCSADRTAEIAKSYDERLTYIKTDKLIPLYAARNIGLNYFKGDYLAFLDSDDVWISYKLENQLKILKQTSAKFLYGNYGNIVEHPSKVKRELIKVYLGLLKINLNFRKNGYISTNKIIKNYDINLQTVIMRKDILKENKFNESLNLYGDFEYFTRRLLQEKVNAFFLRKKLSLSRVHQRQLSRKNNENWIKEFKICLKALGPLMTHSQKRQFLKSHYFLHQSNFLMEKNKFKKAWIIKFSLCFQSIPLFFHFTKSSIDILSKKFL